MAEQEARADVLKRPVEDAPNATVQGESLLPLLQGLLNVPENEQTADSGTESGEDLRGGLLNEVQCALAKLATSLKSDATEMTPEKRNTLLQLVTKLQAGLSSQTYQAQPTNERRSSSGSARFVRRRQRQNRHTVGVSSEELEDARRLMEEIALREGLTADIIPRQFHTPIKKQNSEGSVASSKKTDYHPVNPSSNKVPVKNAVAKPYSSSNTSLSQSGASLSHSGASLCHSGASSTAHTPSERTESPDFSLNRSEIKSHSRSSSQENILNEQKKPSTPKRQSAEKENVGMNAVTYPKPSLKNTLVSKQESDNESGDEQSDSESQASEEEENSNAYIRYNNSSRKPEKQVPRKIETQYTPKKPASPPRLPQEPEQYYETKAAVVLKTNPAYSDRTTIHDDPNKVRENMKNNRFNSKKSRMKRANTIDIPKPLVFYEDDDSDEDDDKSPRGDGGFGLRGPIQVGGRAHANKQLPTFEPRTDNDRKFMAFISKFNEHNAKATTAWSNRPPETPTKNHWGSKFGSIKNAFENASAQNSAKNFWKSADDALSAGRISYNGPTISRRGARDLQKMFEEKTKQNRQPPAPTNNFVTSPPDVIDANIHQNHVYRVIPKPAPINKFSHAPTSAFAPIPKKNSPSISQSHAIPPSFPEKPTSLELPQNIVKIDLKNDDPTSPGTSLYLYSPKPLQKNDTIPGTKTVFSPVSNSTPWSPVSNTTPWSKSTDVGEHRVQKLAASKFEKSIVKNEEPPKPRHEKIAIPVTFQKPAYVHPEHPPASYVAKSIENKNTVRKLSDQFDSIGTKNNAANHTNSFHYAPAKLDQKPVPTAHQYQPVFHDFNKPVQEQFSQRSQSKVSNLQQNFLPKTTPAYVPYNHIKHGINPTQKQNEINNRISSTQGHHDLYDGNKDAENPQFTAYSTVQLARPVVRSPKEHKQEQPNFQVQANTTHYTPRESKAPTKQTPNLNVSKPKYNSQLSGEPKRPQYNTQMSNESIREYQAAETKVMKGPVSHQAVKVQNNTPKTRNEHDMEAAFNLKVSLNKFKQNENVKPAETAQPAQPTSFKQSPGSAFYSPQNAQEPIKSKPVEPKPQINTYQNAKIQEQPRRVGNESYIKPIQTSGYHYREKVEETSFKTKNREPEKPSRTSNSSIQRASSLKYPSSVQTQKVVPNFFVNDTPVGVDALESKGKAATNYSKLETWQRVVQENQSQGKPVVKSLLKSKSSNTLAVPNLQFQAGMTKDELLHKKRTIEAYFSGSGSRSPQSVSRSSSDDGLEKREGSNASVPKSSINRKKTSQKASAQSQSSGVVRSRTLPNIVCPRLLDESNIEEAFEDLFRSVA